MPSLMSKNVLEAFLESYGRLHASSSYIPHLSSHHGISPASSHGLWPRSSFLYCLAQGALCRHCAEVACTEEGERRKSRDRWLSIGFGVPCVSPPLISLGATSPSSLQPVTETGIRSHSVPPGLVGSGPRAGSPHRSAQSHFPTAHLIQNQHQQESLGKSVGGGHHIVLRYHWWVAVL